MIIREPRGSRLEALHQRATADGGERFADGLCDMIEQYRSWRAAAATAPWPQWPTPGNTMAEAKRIMQAAAEVLAAIHSASPVVQARLRHHLREQGRDSHDFSDRGASTRALYDLMDAAATIYQAQPLDKNGKPATRRKDEARDAFLRALREHFTAHRVAWNSTADEWSDYERTSLAVAVVVAALDVKPAAASKAIQRIDET